jgi:putative glycosyltransferase (TIGR04372 family)
MNRRVIKKKFYQEVIYDVHGARNSKVRIVLRFSSLCLKAFGGVLLTLVLAPISLFRPIEIWYLRSRRAKISLMIEDLEWGLRNLQARKLQEKVFIIASYKLPFPNNQLAKMYRRVLLLLGKKQNLLSRCLQFVLPIGRISKKNPIERFEPMFKNWNDAAPSLNFINKEIKRGLELEEELFGGKSPPFVCFATTSKKYKLAVDVPATKYHGDLIDDPFISIPDLNNYVSVINQLTNSGIAVLRMGSLEEERLPADLGPLVIDYAFDFRSEFGDVWLHSKCLFSLVAGAGSHWFGAAFNRPTLLTDSYAIRSTYDNQDLFIPQCGWLVGEGRYLSFSEIGSSEFSRDPELLKNGLKIVKNSPEEIVEVTTEMILRLSGEWLETDEDRELQSRYREIVDSFQYHHRTPARMGAKFLREHQHLLPQ